jgi:hypothetical protein
MRGFILGPGSQATLQGRQVVEIEAIRKPQGRAGQSRLDGSWNSRV